MKLFAWTNRYLSSIQHGIQVAHAVAELMRMADSRYSASQLALLNEWATNHKTIVVLNAAGHDNLNSICMNALMYAANIQLMADKDIVVYPHVLVQEDESCNNMNTCFAVVLPESVYGLRTAEDIMTSLTEHNALDAFYRGLIQSSRSAR